MNKLIILIALIFLTISCKNDFEVTRFNPSSLTLDQLKESNDVSKCIECHGAIVSDWKKSDHYHSMLDANTNSVLADFNSSSFKSYENSYVFKKIDKDYFININNTDYKVVYTFGHDPIQQYVVSHPNKDGHFQVPTIAWHVANKKWIETIDKNLEVHQIKSLGVESRLNNWNNRCASCHSSGTIKNYDYEKDSYKTSFVSKNVSCFSCHNDATKHLEWASKYKNGDASKEDKHKGFYNSFISNVRPIVAPGASHPITKLQDAGQNQQCFSCHGLRQDLTTSPFYSNDYLKQFKPRIVNSDLYHMDGQLKEEAFVMGSFTQSKMYHNGVQCINCHNPHSTKLKLEGNKLCLQCHTPDYATKSHTKHKVDSANCFDCHMPKREFMASDKRADHSFSIPRPDYSLKYSTPNSCTSCHTDWNKDQMVTKFKSKWPKLKTRNELLEILGEMKLGNFKGKSELLSYIQNTNHPEMKRAMAISYLREFPSMKIQEYQELLSADSDLIKLATLELVSTFPDTSKLNENIVELAKSSNLSLAYPAIYLLATKGYQLKSDEKLAKVLNDYIKTLFIHSDSPDNVLKLAQLSRFSYVTQSPSDLLSLSVKRYPYFAASYINLADLYRQVGDEDTVINLLLNMNTKDPSNATVLSAIGMHYTRKSDYFNALRYFKEASDKHSENPYYYYLYILTYKSQYGSQKALAEAVKREDIYESSFLYNQLLFGLSVELQDVELAKKYTEKVNRFRR